ASGSALASTNQNRPGGSMRRRTSRSPRDDNSALVKAFLDWQANVRGRSPRTVYDYAHRLASLLDWVDFTPLEEVTLQEFEAWLRRTRGRNGVTVGKPSTKAKDVAVVRSFFSYLEGHGYVGFNVT